MNIFVFSCDLPALTNLSEGLRNDVMGPYLGNINLGPCIMYGSFGRGPVRKIDVEDLLW